MTRSVLCLSLAEDIFPAEPAATEFALWLKAGTFLEGEVGALIVVPWRTWSARSGSWDGGTAPTSPSCSSLGSFSSPSSPRKSHILVISYESSKETVIYMNVIFVKYYQMGKLNIPN